jgi:hypothetical protein
MSDWPRRNVGKPLFATIFASWAIERRRGDRRGNYTRRGTPAAPFQKRRLVAIKQQALQGVLGWRVLTCQWIRRFGTMASTSRNLLRRFRWQAQDLFNSVRYKEKFHE